MGVYYRNRQGVTFTGQYWNVPKAKEKIHECSMLVQTKGVPSSPWYLECMCAEHRDKGNTMVPEKQSGKLLVSDDTHNAFLPVNTLTKKKKIQQLQGYNFRSTLSV